MKITKCKYKKKKQIYISVCKVKYPVVLQKSIFTALNANKSSYLLPLNIVKKGKKKVKFEAFCQEYKPLNLWFKYPIEKYLFFNIILNIISNIQKCQELNLNTDNLELDINYILYNQQLDSVKLVYWPIVNNVDYVSPHLFFKNLINQVQFINHDVKFLYNYNDYMSSLKPFSLVHFKKFIYELQGKKVVTCDIAPSKNLQLSTSLSQIEKINVQNNIQNVNISYDPLPISQSVDKTSKKISKTISNSINFEEVNEINHLHLVRVSNNEQITVNSGVFKIGKSNTENNYVIKGNSAISRKHAEIIFKDNQYYIIDCNSTNGVRLNERRINPMVEYKIKSGDRLAFADENFLVE